MVHHFRRTQSWIPLLRSARCVRPSSNQTFPRVRQYASQPASGQTEAFEGGKRYWSDHGLIKWIPRGLAMVLGYHIVVTYFFVFDPTYGISMLPTLQSSGDWVLISRVYRKGRGVAVGDLVSFIHPVTPGMEAVKRVLAMPGDFVLRDTPGHGQGQLIQVPTGHCYVVGDNLNHSRDSRMFGPLPMALVKGKVIAKWSWGLNWPSWIRDGLEGYTPDDDELD